MRRLGVIMMVAVCLATCGLVAGCGSSSSSSTASNSAAATSATGGTTHFAKTKFVLHAGLAFGAFHRYVYKPFKAGDFKHPFTHKLTLIKAGLSALFIRHELRLAAGDVQSSKLLSKLFSPITALAARVGSLKSSITSGKISSSDMNGLNSSVSSISSQAGAKGQAINDQVPSASQLASGGS